MFLRVHMAARNIRPIVAFDNADEDKAKYASDINSMVPYWDKVDAVMEGEESVKDAGELFIPKFPAETKTAYDYRIQCGKFTNIFSDIVEDLSSKPFEEEIAIVEDDGKAVPELIKEFCEDVDGAGNNLSVFSEDVFFNGIQNAVDWIFVDFPKTDGSVRTIADQKKAGLRPNWSRVIARNVREVRSKIVNGREVLSYMRIYEPGTPDKVREFTRGDNGLVSWILYERTEDKKWIVDDQGDLSIDVIPLVPFISGRRNGRLWSFKPPLKNALTLQVTLYRQESQLEWTRTMCAFPMLAANGISPQKDAEGKPKEITVGPNRVLYGPRDGNGNAGSWDYVEPSGSSLEFMSKDNDKTKQDLRELGKQPLTAQSGNLTVITTAVAAGKAKASVKAWGNALKDTLENALVITCKWLNISDLEYSPELNIYDDYNDFSDASVGVDALGTARAAGDISRKTYLTELKRRRILSAEFDIDKEDALLLKEVPGDPPDDDDDQTQNPARKPDGTGATVG